MKMFPKAAVLLVSSALLASACGKAENGASPSPSSANGNASPSPVAAEKKEKLELKWMVQAPNGVSLPSADKDFVKKAIDEKFNVDLKIEFMQDGQDYRNKMNMKISSGDIPDMFIASGTDSLKYAQDKVLMDISGVVTPQTMPNYFKYWIAEDVLKRYQVLDMNVRAPKPFAKKQYYSYYVRKDWLDKLGLKMPETYDDMITVMKAFVEKDPDGNGKNDTYGMTAGGNGANVVRDFPEFFKNGIIAGFYLDNGQFVDSGTDIRMGQALDDLKKSMDMKLYDPNWFLNKGDQVENAIVQGKVGIFLGTTREAALDNYAVSYQKKTKDITGDQKADWQPFHPWANSGVFTEPLPGYPFLFSVKTPEAKVKRSTEILDWLSGEEGFLLTHYGLEGVHYKKSGNKIELIPDAIKKDIADNGNFLDIYGFFTPAEPQSLGLELVDPRETDRDRAILAKISTYKYLPSIGTSVSVKEGMDLASVRKQMNVYQSKILFEEKDASNWPKYREELMNKYGGKKIFEYYAEQITKAHGKTYTFKADN